MSDPNEALAALHEACTHAIAEMARGDQVLRELNEALGGPPTIATDGGNARDGG